MKSMIQALLGEGLGRQGDDHGLALRYFGPGLMGGLTLSKWVCLLRDNHFAVAPSCLPRFMAITCQSLQNSLFHWNDQRQFGSKVNELVVPPPLFLLGHWRNGTTHLHNLLTVDERFAFPNNYQALFPDTFLTAESLHSRSIEFFLPKRRPMDNVEWTMRTPQEDEFALCISTFKSPCMGWVFPQRRDYSSAEYFGSRRVSEIAQRLEILGREGNLRDASATITTLEAEVSRFLAAVEQFTL